MSNTEYNHKNSSGISNTHSNPISENVIRFQKKDPLKKYEIIKVLGEGSIGAVSCVKIKDEAIGGSAYKEPVDNVSGIGVDCCCWPSSSKNNNNSNPSQSKHNSQNTNNNLRKSTTRNNGRGILYAMKSIQIKRINNEFLDELRNEISILQSMDHPNIVKAYEVYEWKGQIYVIMEHCSGGDLYARRPYNEIQAKKIIKNLCSAISYMHSNNIIHRDLKFENIMFDSITKEEESEIKVIDFGLSKKFQPGEKLTDGVGTIYTMAPQVLQGVYTTKADMWSIGVIAYVLLSGTKPFYARNRRHVIDKIMRCKYNFHGTAWNRISNKAKDFISKLIEIDPKKRMSAKEALQHPWLTSNELEKVLSPKRNVEDDIRESELMGDIENNIYTFANTSALKKLALMIVAHKSSPEETKELRNAFSKYDANNSGTISKDEFQKVLKDYNKDLSEGQIDNMFNSIDINNNGVILYTEFLAATLEASGNIEEERIADAFDRLDADDSGYISKKNLQDMLSNTTLSSNTIDEIINEVDTNNDGKISFDEFLVAMQKTNTNHVEELYRMESQMNLGSGDTGSTTSSARQNAADLSESGSELVGLESFVVGGKYDTKSKQQLVDS